MKENKNNRPVVAGVRKTVNPPYCSGHTEDLLMLNLQACWRRKVGQNRFRKASPQGIAAFAAQGGAAILTEGRGAAFEVR